MIVGEGHESGETAARMRIRVEPGGNLCGLPEGRESGFIYGRRGGSEAFQVDRRTHGLE